MKHLILVFLLIPNLAFAECKWATGVAGPYLWNDKLQDGYMAYSIDCHKRVGKLVQDEDDLKLENTELRKSLELKDLAIQNSYKEIDLWKVEAMNQNDKLNKVQKASRIEKWVWFGLGVVVTGAAVYGAGQLK